MAEEEPMTVGLCADNKHSFIAAEGDLPENAWCTRCKRTAGEAERERLALVADAMERFVTTDEHADNWLGVVGAQLSKEVDRLWPEETNPAYRGACLAEEAGEVNRAITKRRHAEHAPDGKCKGKTVAEWTDELRIELAQALGVILDIAHREGFDLAVDIEECVVILQARKAGS